MPVTGSLSSPQLRIIATGALAGTGAVAVYALLSGKALVAAALA